VRAQLKKWVHHITHKNGLIKFDKKILKLISKNLESLRKNYNI